MILFSIQICTLLSQRNTSKFDANICEGSGGTISYNVISKIIIKEYKAAYAINKTN